MRENSSWSFCISVNFLKRDSDNFCFNFYKDVCRANCLGKYGLCPWRKEQICLLPGIIKIMSPSCSKIVQVCCRPFKRLKFPKLRVPLHVENSFRPLCIPSVDLEGGAKGTNMHIKLMLPIIM